MDLREIGARIRAARIAAGMSQQTLAEKIGVSMTTVSRWELGKSEIETGNLNALCELVGTGPEHLLYGARSTMGVDVHSETVKRILSSDVGQRLTSEQRRALAALLGGRDIPEWRALAALEMLFGGGDK